MIDAENTRRLSARFVFTGDGESIENGTVEIVDGVIAAVHDRRNAKAEDLGNAAIIPGLVNVHTHLEFSDQPKPIEPATSFTEWIRGLVACRRSRTEPITNVVSRGLFECIAEGTTTVGEIATDDDCGPYHAESGPRTTVFREILGFAPEQVEPQMETARGFLDAGRLSESDRFQPALSPHAPYSVHPEMLRQLVQLTQEQDVPLAMHLAETRDELQLLADGTGPFRELLESFGAWRNGVLPANAKPLDYLRMLAEAPRALVVHGNYLSNEECEFLADAPGMSLIYCPRTHYYFGLEPHPWRTVVAGGGNVALGTDGRGSNPDLSLWRELQFLAKRHAEVDVIELLRLGTINGARALGLDNFTGSLQPGKSADLAVVRLQPGSSANDLFADAHCVERAMVGGSVVN